jgi:hypothetical protein
MIWKMTCYDLFIIYFNRVVHVIHDVARNKLMNIDRKSCNSIPKAASSAHSCETQWNKHDSSYYSLKVLSQGKILAILSTSIW